MAKVQGRNYQGWASGGLLTALIGAGMPCPSRSRRAGWGALWAGGVCSSLWWNGGAVIQAAPRWPGWPRRLLAVLVVLTGAVVAVALQLQVGSVGVLWPVGLIFPMVERERRSSLCPAGRGGPWRLLAVLAALIDAGVSVLCPAPGGQRGDAVGRGV